MAVAQLSLLAAAFSLVCIQTSTPLHIFGRGDWYWVGVSIQRKSAAGHVITGRHDPGLVMFISRNPLGTHPIGLLATSPSIRVVTLVQYLFSEICQLWYIPDRC